MAAWLAGRDGLQIVSVEVSDLTQFQLPPASVDLVSSCYGLHHLAGADKRRWWPGRGGFARAAGLSSRT